MQALLIIAAAALVIGFPILAFGSDRLTPQLQQELGNSDVTFPLFAVLALLAIMFAIVTLAYLFLRNLRRIVDTVGEGDPFVPANAKRLANMAWIMLAIQIAAVPLVAFIWHIEAQLEETRTEITANVDLSGLVLVLLLFILARVFRKGTEMRADLEGTV